MTAASKKIILTLSLSGLILWSSLGLRAQACTLWAAAGIRAAEGGTLICKNRDWWPHHCQGLRLVATPGGFRFLELYAVGRKYSGEKAGVNEKGLVMVSAAASCLPLRERARARSTGNLTAEILASCDRVEAVVGKQHLFTSPGYYLIADRSQIAIIEVGLEEKRSVKITGNDILCHTNHYLDENLWEDNRQVKLTSQIRLIRIRHLLKAHRQPFTLEDFIGFSQDRHDGPDNSIWRTGGAPGKIRTLSSWIVSLPRNGSPTLYVKLADPQEPVKIYRLKLDASFWAKGSGVVLKTSLPVAFPALAAR